MGGRSANGRAFGLVVMCSFQAMAKAEKKAGMEAIADTDHFFETITPPVAIGPRLGHAHM